MLASGKLDKGPIFQGMSGFQTTDNYGSTDVGDVQYIVPCVQVRTACWNLAAPGHSWQITAQSCSSMANKGTMVAAKVMALTAAKAIAQPELLEKAKAELVRTTGGKYVSAMPPEIMPNIE